MWLVEGPLWADAVIAASVVATVIILVSIAMNTLMLDVNSIWRCSTPACTPASLVESEGSRAVHTLTAKDCVQALSGYWDSSGDHSEVVIIDAESKVLTTHVPKHGEDESVEVAIVSSEYIMSSISVQGNSVGKIVFTFTLSGEGAIGGPVLAEVDVVHGTLSLALLSKNKEKPEDLGVFVKDNFMTQTMSQA